MGPVLNVLQAAVGIIFLGAGSRKLAATDATVDLFARLRYPQWLRVVTGVMEVGGGVAMMAGLKRPALVPPAAALLGSVAIGAIASHTRQGDPPRMRMPPLVLLLAVTAVSLVRGRERAAVRMSGFVDTIGPLGKGFAGDTANHRRGVWPHRHCFFESGAGNAWLCPVRSHGRGVSLS